MTLVVPAKAGIARDNLSVIPGRRPKAREPGIHEHRNRCFARIRRTRYGRPPAGWRFMVRYDEHAEFQLARREIDKAWVEETLANPDHTETKGQRRSFFKCLPGHHVMLRVVTPLHDSEYVITAYFDRTKPCA